MSIQKQSGFAHLAIITIILALGLVGTLGFVYYQNFIQDKNVVVDTNTDTDGTNTAEAESSYKTYSNDMFSFQYPKSGWSIEATYDSDVSLKTSEYVTDPMGVATGSKVDIAKFDNTYYSTIADQISSYKVKGMITEVIDMKVDGQSAYQYACYEFCTSTTLFEKDGVGYIVQFSSANTSDAQVYNKVLETLVVK